jgi:hypothetical protein
MQKGTNVGFVAISSKRNLVLLLTIVARKICFLTHASFHAAGMEGKVKVKLTHASFHAAGMEGKVKVKVKVTHASFHAAGTEGKV